jgi:class 3 adenylate cyclase
MFGTVADRRSIQWVGVLLKANYVLVTLCVITYFLLSLVVIALYLLGGLGSANFLVFVLWDWLLPGLFMTIAMIPSCHILSLAASILYRGAVDPRLMLARFTLWSVLGLIVTVVFLVIERGIALKVVELFNLPPESGGVAAGAVVAASFQPIRKFSKRTAEAWSMRLLPTSFLADGLRTEGAVVVTDISGYTALSAKDEATALLATTLVQKVARQMCDENDGRFIKSTGDGALMRFHTADEAIKAVGGLHEAVLRGSDALGISNLALHTGLHWGEFVETQDGDIYGQTVNLAARIADRARAGEIWTSEAFSARLTTTQNNLLAMGPQDFKNVPGGVPCMKVVPG